MWRCAVYLGIYMWRCAVYLGIYMWRCAVYLGVCDENTVGVLVFRCNVIVRQQVSQLLDKADHLLVPWDVLHGQCAGL